MDLSEYIVEPLRKDEEFTLFRGQHRDPGHAARSSILLMAPLSSHSAPSRPRHVEHERSRNSEDMAWGVRPIGVVQYDGQPVLVLENSGSEPLDALIRRPMKTGPFLRIALVKAFEEIKRLNDRLESENAILRERVDRPSDSALEIKRLQRCMNDLIGLLGLPAAWKGREPGEILPTLVDSLMGMLSLDFLYARVTVDADQKPLEVLRVGPSNRADEVAHFLDDWLGEHQINQPSQGLRKIGDQEVSIFPMRMGVEGDLGFIVAGSQRLGFPEQTEKLVLGVAANQTAVVLQQALLLSEQTRIAGELDRLVAERTRELAETNAELQLQVGLLQHLPVSAWTLKPDGTPDFVNQVWLNFSGQTHDFVRSHPEAWMTAVHPDHREAASKALWEGVRSGQSFAFETRSLRAKDGTWRWHLQQAVVLRDAEGKVLKFVGTTTDIDDQKRAEEELRASEVKLRRVIDTIPTLAWCNLPDGPNEFLSQSWHQYTGLSPEEAHGWGWQAAFHPEDLPPLMKAWQQLLISKESGEIEARLRRHDGEFRWFLIRVSPFCDETGTILRWYGTSTDIHDRKLADEALRASENNFRQIVDSIPGLVCTMSATGEIEHLNRQLLEYFGKTPGELKGWRLTDAVHPDDLPEVFKAFTYSVTTGTPYDIEHRCRRADGVYRWFQVRARAVHDTDDRIHGWYVLLTDIEDRKRAEEALRASESDLRQVLDNIPGLVNTLSPAGQIELANQPLMEYFGMTVEELNAWGTNGAVHPDDLARVTAGFSNSMITGTPYNSENRYRGADGVYRWFQVRTLPSRNREGRITRWYCLNTDIEDRKRAEDELKRSEAQYRVVIETAGDAVVSIDESGAIILANPATKRIFGYNQADLIGKHLSTLMPGAMREIQETGFTRHLETSARTLNSHGIEMTALRANGEEFPAEVSFGAMTSGEQRIFTGFIRDISDAKRAEEAILASERNLSLTIDTMPVLAWSARPDGGLYFVNQPWLVYTGLSPRAAEGWGWTATIHPDDVERLTEYWLSALAAGQPGEIEVRQRRFDGEYRWFLIRGNPLRDDSGTVVRWYGTNTDIHDRKLAEEQALRSEAFLAEAQHLARLGSFSWRVATGEIKWSEQLYRIFEFDPAVQITFALVGSRIHPEDLPVLDDMMARAQDAVTDLEYQHRLLMPDGSIKFLHFVAHASRDRDGQLEYVGAVQDVTQRQLSEAALATARAELAKIAGITSLGILTASIAHEVNQPLSGIMTNAATCLRMLNSDPPNIDGARETARRAIRDGNRASDVITRLRALFGKKEVGTELVDLNEASREVVALSLSDLQRNRVILLVDFADCLPPVRGDRIQLQQVVLNLVRNASDAMSCVEDRPRRLTIGTETVGGDVRLTVQDSGIGFSPETADRLFESFYTTKEDGMGIGLSVSRSIIQAHNGQLWATPNDGPGVTFAFSIPYECSS
jgi:PAS domain S-box-containing protein